MRVATERGRAEWVFEARSDDLREVVPVVRVPAFREVLLHVLGEAVVIEYDLGPLAVARELEADDRVKSFGPRLRAPRLNMSSRTSNAKEEQLDAIFSALGDSTRRKILARLARGSTTITDLAAPFAMTLPAVSKHLRVLENAGLVKRLVTVRFESRGDETEIVIMHEQIPNDEVRESRQTGWTGCLDGLVVYAPTL